MLHKVNVISEPTPEIHQIELGDMALICGCVYIAVDVSNGRYVWWGVASSNGWSHYAYSKTELREQLEVAKKEWPEEDTRLLDKGTKISIIVGEGL